MNFLIVVPTYNEISNLRDFVTQLFEKAGHQAPLHGIEKFHVLIVDDNSPDGTGELADELARDNPQIFVIHRLAKEGLGKAYIAGFSWALDRKYDVICEMDADLSHNPKYLMDMWVALKYSDVVIGSRYVDGGGVKNWGLMRKLISRGGSLYVRTLLKMNIQDITGGFNAWKTEVLEAIDISSIESEGYAFQIELKWKAWKKKFKIVEIPIIFRDRLKGKSKISRRIIVEAAIRVANMYWE